MNSLLCVSRIPPDLRRTMTIRTAFLNLFKWGSISSIRSWAKSYDPWLKVNDHWFWSQSRSYSFHIDHEYDIELVMIVYLQWSYTFNDRIQFITRPFKPLLIMTPIVFLRRKSSLDKSISEFSEVPDPLESIKLESVKLELLVFSIFHYWMGT